LYPNTLSPTVNEMTPGPTAATTPANSVPRTVTFGRMKPLNARTMNGLADRKPQSVRLTVATCTRTSTSVSPMAGWATSAICATSGGPYLVLTAAFTSAL